MPIMQLLRDAADSETFKERLASINKNFRTCKNEGRYRDALLEQFNANSERHGLVAVAEHKLVDMSIFSRGNPRQAPFRVEFKYNFTPDLVERVARKLPDGNGFDDLVKVVEDGYKGNWAREAEGIIKDCLFKKHTTKKKCDGFIFILQDRRRAKRRTENGFFKTPYIHEQIRLDKAPDPEEWADVLNSLFEGIQQRRAFRMLPPVSIQVCEGPQYPLTSHIYFIDFGAEPAVPFGG